MAKRRPSKKRGVSTGTILLALALAAVFVAAMALVAWRLFPPAAVPQPRPPRPPSVDLDRMGKLLAREAEAALVSPPVADQGRLISSEKGRGSTGSLYRITWSGHSDTSLVLAEKAVEDAWRDVDGRVRVGASYPESSPSGERIRMVAGLSEIPLIELTLKLEPKDLVPAPAPPRPEKPIVRGRHTGRIAIIIDDIGNDLAALDELLALPAPLTFSVLPNSVHREEALERLKAAGAPVMLHLPMEPVSYPDEDPGPGALLVGMDRAEIEKRVEAALDAVPLAEGVNNHMGSAFTADPEGMTAALEVIKAHGLFFIDSRTSPKTMAYALAHKLGLRAAERKVFLDHDENADSIRAEVRALAADADKEGMVVGIGHPLPETITVLQKAVPELKRAGYVFVPAREAVK